MRIDRCRACGARDLELVLDLGDMPLANSLTSLDGPAGDEPTFPLRLVYCGSCTLVQIDETVDPEVLFRDYVYFSSYSEAVVQNARQLSERLVKERGLDAGSLVLEIASNDGYLLQWFQRANVPVLGVEPARNVAAVANERGIPTENDFFGRESARRLAARTGGADVVIGNNVLAHVADLPGFVEGVRAVLKPSGVAVFEVPYVRDMIEKREFDTIYHEHLCYYSATALDRLFRSHGLALHKVERLTIHGGSLRVFFVHEGAAPPGASVAATLDEERRAGVTQAATYRGFGKAVESLRASLVALLDRLASEGRSIAAYGAAAKGATLLNYCGIDFTRIAFVADVSPHKQGKRMPGVRIPIVPPSTLLEARPDVVLLLAWNHADEIMRQQDAYRRAGGRFLVPVPDPKVV